MKIKNIIRILTLLPLSIYLLYCCYHFIANKERPTYLDCGKVVSKSNDEVTIKHGTRTELYLNIQFNKSGFRSIECDPTTYFSKKVGDSVCFDLDQKTSFWYKTNNVIGIMVLVISGVIALALFIGYLV